MATVNERMTTVRFREPEAQAVGKLDGNLATTTITAIPTALESPTQDNANGANQADHLEVLDSRTGQVYSIPVSDGFVRGSDLSTIKAPIPGTEGRLRSLAVLDPGFQNTACKESSITLIDGERGELRYRGVTVEDLFHNHDFDSTFHLLVWGRLPTVEEKVKFEQRLVEAAKPPQEVLNVIRSLPRNTNFYSMLTIGLAAYVATDKEMTTSRCKPVMTYHKNLAKTDDAIIRSTAYVSTTMAICYCHMKGVELREPQPGLTLVENFLHMIGMEDPDKKVSRTIDRLWILMADHELSCSTAAFLHTASTLTDPMSCILAAIASGAGPLHAGAIELCYHGLQMLETVENVPAYIEAVKNKQFRLFGYGHRVYKTKDPRATLIEELMEEHRDIIDANPLLQVALEIDRQANTDPYFVERKLKLNADFFSCFLYIALGLPQEIVSGLMTIPRMGGFMAHWREAMDNPIKIWRPKQKYKA
ncbi:hypothetical protein VMCG_01542 [Cytospora schulzeri]|uniref:Citrate synthase n=1 Tax=Cytospora schulzeri TaxID=448051 RepID=A0A423X647_9PEZI|nr:hypothetical protein VMCG_01542 [Valsa malicola]